MTTPSQPSEMRPKRFTLNKLNTHRTVQQQQNNEEFRSRQKKKKNESIFFFPIKIIIKEKVCETTVGHRYNDGKLTKFKEI